MFAAEMMVGKRDSQMDELIPGYNQLVREFDIQEATLLLEQYGLEVCDPSAEDPPSIDVVMTNEIK